MIVCCYLVKLNLFSFKKSKDSISKNLFLAENGVAFERLEPELGEYALEELHLSC